MKNIDFTTIYNIPEKISGLGCGAHFIGFCLLPALILCAIPCILTDNTWLKDSIDLIISSGVIMTVCWAFILIACPIYFFIRFVMELFRYKMCKHKFYSTPNIEYIKLNNDNIFFKNTCPNHDFTIIKSDIVNVTLDGKVKSISGIKPTGTPKVTTYVENLTLTIKTVNDTYTICPQIKRKQLPKGMIILDEIELLKQQIAFYKSYFDNFNVLFDSDETNTANELENDIPNFLRR